MLRFLLASDADLITTLRVLDGASDSVLAPSASVAMRASTVPLCTAVRAELAARAERAMVHAAHATPPAVALAV